jgi:FkbM family methyltransferase
MTWGLVALCATGLLILILVPRLRAYIPFYPWIRFWIAVILGNNRYSLGDALRGYRDQLRHDVVTNEFHKKTRFLERGASGAERWETAFGPFWIPKGADPRFLSGVLAEQVRDVYGKGKHAVQPGDIVLDCGANIGAFTHKALQSGARLVIAVEISPATAECLRRNFAREIEAGRVIVYGKGMWHKDDTLTLRVHPHNSGENTVVMTSDAMIEGPTVPLTTIDNLMRELRLERVDFIKMDIEGAEQSAIAGARNTLAKFRPRLALTAYHLSEDPVKIPELVRGARPDYKMSCGPCEVYAGQIRPDILYFN